MSGNESKDFPEALRQHIAEEGGAHIQNLREEIEKENASDEAVKLLKQKLGTYEPKPECILIAAIQEDPHAFDGMWYPTALTEDGIALLAANQPEGFEDRNLFFIKVTTDI